MFGFISFIPVILRIIVMIYDLITQLRAQGIDVQDVVAEVTAAKKANDLAKLRMILEGLKSQVGE
jgi:EAL domain-containing protein (putative c-di-GMP-specific phosphodiesterase class I)